MKYQLGHHWQKTPSDAFSMCVFDGEAKKQILELTKPHFRCRVHFPLGLGRSTTRPGRSTGTSGSLLLLLLLLLSSQLLLLLLSLLLLLLLLLGTSGSPPGKTFPSTCTRRSPHLTSPNLRSVNKSGDDHSPSGNGNVLSKSAMGQALGVWFCACKCPYGGRQGLFTPSRLPRSWGEGHTGFDLLMLENCWSGLNSCL